MLTTSNARLVNSLMCISDYCAQHSPNNICNADCVFFQNYNCILKFNNAPKMIPIPTTLLCTAEDKNE